MSTQPQWRIWIAGEGGQGVSFMAQVLCRAALMSQRHAIARSEQQWAIRGGRVSASVLVDAQSFSPAEISDYNWLIYLHPACRELVPPLAPDARVLDAYALEAYMTARAAGFAQGLNMVMLGHLLALSEVCPVDAVAWQLRHLLGRADMEALPYNLELLDRGLKFCPPSQAPAPATGPVIQASGGESTTNGTTHAGHS